MTLLERIKQRLSGTAEERLYRYHCRECENTFESTELGASAVACPNCGADANRSIAKL